MSHLQKAEVATMIGHRPMPIDQGPSELRIPKSRARRPAGVVGVAVIVLLSLIALIVGALLRQGMARRAQARAEERRLQADWLAESALERASARLAAGDYQGETWEIPAADLGGRHAATVRIDVETSPGRSDPARVRVKVRAEYPRGAESPARRRREAWIESGQKTQAQGNQT
jgi:hypothetical protein